VNTDDLPEIHMARAIAAHTPEIHIAAHLRADPQFFAQFKDLRMDLLAEKTRLENRTPFSPLLTGLFCGALAVIVCLLVR
jgi:hypothetical protein